MDKMLITSTANLRRWSFSGNDHQHEILAIFKAVIRLVFVDPARISSDVHQMFDFQDSDAICAQETKESRVDWARDGILSDLRICLPHRGHQQHSCP